MSIATPSLADLSLVPVDRLAALLSGRVATSGLTLVELLGHEGPPGIDIDPAALPEATVRKLADYVEEHAGPLLAERVTPLIDVRSGRISIDGLHARLRRRRTIERVCRAYLRLVYERRDLPSGTRFPVRAHDLRTLSDATNVPFAAVRTQLWREMEHLGRLSHSRAARVREQIMLPAAGILVSAGAVTSYQLARRSGVETPTLLQAQANAQATEATTSVPGTPPGSFDGLSGHSAVVLPTLSGHDHGGSGVGELVPERNPLEEVPLGTPIAAPDPDPEPGSPGDVGAQALALIDYDWETELPGWTVEFLGHEPGRLGYAFFQEQRIEIYVRVEQSPFDVATVIAHELGHAVDITLFNGDDRDAWLHVRGLEGHAWWPEPGARSDFASGAGDWAESFAHWLLDDESQSELGHEPDAEELALIDDLVRG